MLYSVKTRELTFERFRALRAEKPRSKMALVRGLYPEISTTLQMGHTLKDVHHRLVEDGLDMSYELLLTYVNRIRREKGRLAFVQRMQPRTAPIPKERTQSAAEDPWRSPWRLSTNRGIAFATPCVMETLPKKVDLTVRFPLILFLTK